MLVLPKFAHYERPEGFEPGHTDLLMRENAIEKYDMPTVNFDNLSRMYSDDLGLQAGKWTVKLFDGNWSGHIDPPLSKLSLGYHIPGTNTIHSAVWYGGYHFSVGHGPEMVGYDGTDTMRKLIRQSVGVAEGRMQPILLAKERAKYIGTPLLAVGVLDKVGMRPWLTAGLPFLASTITIPTYQARKSLRRETKEKTLYDNHRQDIIFTDAAR